MTTAWRARPLAAILLLTAVAAATAAESVPADVVNRAATARAEGDYKTAIAILEKAVAAAADRTDLRLLLAETLAWDKRFTPAEALYQQILAAAPASHDAQLGLARVLLWQGRCADARAAFERLTAANPRDVDANEGRATAAYWSGDFRTAAREFEQVLALDPARTFSQRSLTEIRRRTAPEQRVDVSYVDDDQPYRLLRSAVTASISSDPLTRWSASAGSYRSEAPIYGTSLQPFVAIANETILPALRLKVDSTVGVLRYGDRTLRAAGGFIVSRPVTARSRVLLRAERRELLATATGMRSHPYVTTYAAGWRFDPADGWLAAMEVAALRYFDGNHGSSAFAYVLAPLVSREAFRLHAGVSGTLRDSRDSRFAFAAVSSVRTGNGFDYSYRGEYSPYWAPKRFKEARAVAVAEMPIRFATLKLHVDGGIAHDRSVAFGPASGALPLPAAIYSFGFDRTSHPVRADLTASIPFGSAYRAEVGYENTRTAFYRSKSFHVSVVRHR